MPIYCLKNGGRYSNCTTTPYPDTNNTKFLSHVQWNISNEWFIGGSVDWNYSQNPSIETYYINQVFWDSVNHVTTHNVLLTIPGAGFWCIGGTSNNDCNNYMALPSPSMRKDGLQIYFPSTDGKYSWYDKKCCEDPNGYWCTPHANNWSGFSQETCDAVNSNWGTIGIFLADLAITNPDTTPPAAPSGVVVQ